MLLDSHLRPPNKGAISHLSGLAKTSPSFLFATKMLQTQKVLKAHELRKSDKGYHASDTQCSGFLWAQKGIHEPTRPGSGARLFALHRKFKTCDPETLDSWSSILGLRNDHVALGELQSGSLQEKQNIWVCPLFEGNAFFVGSKGNQHGNRIVLFFLDRGSPKKRHDPYPSPSASS